MPENPPAPLWNQINGEPNTLHFGGLTIDRRGAPAGAFPGSGATGWNPPDPTLAVGPNHIVETVNASVLFFSRNGDLQLSQPVQTFFDGLGATNFQFDPRVIFDRLAGRWVIVCDELDRASLTSKMLVAVSDDADPNGVWYRYRIEAKITTSGANGWPYWMDYPGLGYSKDAVVISGNMFGFGSVPYGTPTFLGVQFIVLPKAPMLTGQPIDAGYLRDPNTASVQIADCFDPAGPYAYGMCKLNSSMVRVYAIGSSGGSPTLQFTGVTIPTAADPVAPAPSNPGQLDTLDGRIFGVSWRNGHLFATHNAVASSGGSMNAVRWYDVDLRNYPATQPTLAQAGEIASGSTVHFHMGAVASNGYGDVSATFTRSASSGDGMPCDSMACARTAGDPVGSMGAPFLLATSAGTTYGGLGENRWGDYVQVVVDPVDEATFWGVGIVADASGRWQTVINSWTVTPAASLNGNTVPGGALPAGSRTGSVSLDRPAPDCGLTISLSSSDPQHVSVPPAVTVPSGSSTASYSLTCVSGDADIQATVIASFRGVQRQAQVTVLAPRLQGTVSLGELSSSPSGQMVTVTVRLPGSTVPLDSYSTALDASGGFSVITHRAGVFDVTVQGTHWMRKARLGVGFDASGANLGSVALLNGDVDGDNRGTQADLMYVRLAYRSRPSDPNWNPNADLNGDGVVSAVDLAIVREHMGQVGDP